mgnify:FL=1
MWEIIFIIELVTHILWACYFIIKFCTKTPYVLWNDFNPFGKFIAMLVMAATMPVLLVIYGITILMFVKNKNKRSK